MHRKYNKNNMSSSNSSVDNDVFPQGILLKRRDVLRKLWRPRYFILDSDAAVMTYHLLSRDVGSNHHANEHDNSHILTSGIDYNVAPRGTIYLAGCTIEANDRLTRPQENLYVLTITPPADNADNVNPCFLAASSEASRNDWIQKLASVCDACEYQADVSVDGTEQGSIASEQQEEKEWTNLIPPARVLSGTPRQLAQRIETCFTTYLPLAVSSGGWKLFLEKDGVSAHERRFHQCSMLKTTAQIPFPPKQVFSLLVDSRRRRDFETNVRYNERLTQYSTHTFLDYYAYQAVWPTLARDFGVVLHWRILCRENGERAICMLAFSDDAADEVKPPASDHVRADLKISLYLLEPTHDHNHTLLTRIVSYDLCGNVPKSLTSKVVQQQATLPLVITQYLNETEPDPPVWLTGSELTNSNVEKNVIDKLSKEPINGSKRLPKFAERGESLLMTDDSSRNELDEGALDDLSLTLTAVLLLTPLILWSFANSLNLPGKEMYFLLAAVLAVRAVVLSNLGLRYEATGSSPNVEKVTCRFSVDLKGVLRFIANRKEEQEEEQMEATEVSVIHIVIGAIAVAMSEVSPLKCRRVSNPLIGINGYYFSRRGGVDISLLVPSSEDGKRDDIYNLNGIRSSLSVQSVANRIVEEQDRMNEARKADDLISKISKFIDSVSFWRGPSLGTCLVVASPDHSDHSEVDIDSSPLPGSGVNVVVVVGGVRLVRDTKPSSAPGRSSAVNIKAPPKPTLSMSITIDCPICSVSSSRRFAERVQQLVQFPEMCED